MAMADGLIQLEGRPTAQLIADHLREQIIHGIFPPGQQINESVLADQLSTSRGPVREALQRLTQEGLLVSLRNRGVFVKELTIADIREIYAVREAVEKASAEILLTAADSQIDRTRESLKEIVAEMANQESVGLAGDLPARHAVPHHLRSRHPQFTFDADLRHPRSRNQNVYPPPPGFLPSSGCFGAGAPGDPGRARTSR